MPNSSKSRRVIKPKLLNSDLRIKKPIHRLNEQGRKKNDTPFQQVIDGLGEAIVFSLDSKYCYTAFNENHRREMKAVWNAEITIGSSHIDWLTIPELKAKTKESLDRVLGGESFVEVQHQPEADVFYEFRWSPVRNAAGEIIGINAYIQNITAFQHAESALRESETNFRTLFENASIGMSLTAPDGRLKQNNKAFADMLGYSVEEMQTLNFAVITHPDDVAESLECVRSLLADERATYRMEKRYRHRAGHFVWTDVSTMLYRDLFGKPVHFITDILDISDRKRTEEALRESLERFEFANRATFNAIWDWNLRTDELRWNENFQLLFGYRADEIEPGIESWTHRIHPEDLDRVKTSIHAAIDTGKQDWSDHYRFRRKDSSYANIDDRGYISRDAGGRPVRMIGAMQDVTESKRAAEALQEANDKLEQRILERTAELQRIMTYNRSLIEASVDPLVTKGPDGKITDVNRATETITGYSRQELIGTDFADYFTDPEKARAGYQKAFETGIIRDYELHLRHRDGHTTPVHYNASVYRDEAGGVVGVFAAARDMTEVKNTESDLIRSKQLLDETGKIARVGGWELDLRKNELSWSEVVKQIHEVGPEFRPTLATGIDFYAPEAVPVISEAIRRAIEEGHSFDVELQLITAKKKKLWVRAIGQAYRDSGEIVKVGGVFQDIDDRKLAEIEAHKNSQQFQLLSTELEIIIDSIPGLVFYKDKNNRFIRVNKYMCDVYKMSKKQLEGLSLNALHSEEQAQAYYEDDLQVIRSRQPKLNIDEPWETEAGIRWVSTSKIPYINETGEVVGIIGVSLDVTERKLAENELKRHRDHLEELVTERTADLAKSRELLLEAQTVARLGSWEFDVVRDEIAGSAEFYRLFGVEPENIIHFSQFVDLLHVDDRERVQRAVADALERNIPLDTDYRIAALDGGWRFLNARGQVFADENGKPIRFIGTCMDITERKRSETELLIKNQVFEKAIVAQSITDEKAFIIHANPEFLRMWGFAVKEQAVGKNVGELLADPDEALRIIEVLLARGSWEGEFLAKRSNGKTFITQGFISSLFNARGEYIGYQSTNLDVTKAREAETLLKETTAELARSNKELELFAYVASHDLQEPLRMVSSYTQLLAQRYEGQLDEKAKKYIDYAVDGSVRMQRLINDLLTYSRISTRGKSPQPTDAHAVLGEAIQNLQAAIEESGAMVTNDDLPTVRADPSQLLQIFQNLIANAIKFRGECPPRIHVNAQDQGREWLFSVQDNGIGIDPQFAGKLFVIFQRLHTRQEYPGTGIGLAVCKRIVERHGGRIWFESAPGKGSTFYFSIPK